MMAGSEAAGEELSTMGLGAWAGAAAPVLMTAYQLIKGAQGDGRNVPKENDYYTQKDISDFSRAANDPNYLATLNSQSKYEQPINPSNDLHSGNALLDMYADMINRSGGRNQGISSGWTPSQIQSSLTKQSGLDINGLRKALGIEDLPDLSQGGDLGNWTSKRLSQNSDAFNAYMAGRAPALTFDQDLANKEDFGKGWNFWTGKYTPPKGKAT